jgi:mRNA interferase MazF
MERGEIWWANLDDPSGAEPAFRRPILIVQSDAFNRTRIATTIGVVLTTNLRLADAPGNVLIPRGASGLPKDSVANVSLVVTIDKTQLTERAGTLPARFMRAVTDGLRLVLSL